MKISYYTGIVSKDSAETKFWRVSQALQNSKLPFICDIEYKYGSYHITVELKEDVFADWNSMEEHIRSYVVAHNKTNHVSKDIENLEKALCNK